MQLSQFEIDVLAALARGEKPAVDSEHRVRLELKGLLTDGATGLRLTPGGEKAARTTSTFQHETIERPEHKVDALGRKKMLERTHALR